MILAPVTLSPAGATTPSADFLFISYQEPLELYFDFSLSPNKP